MQVHKVVEAGRAAIATGKVPWAAVLVWGYSHAPVAWLRPGGPPQPPLQRQQAENDYAIVLTADEQYLLLVASGAGDDFQHA